MPHPPYATYHSLNVMRRSDVDVRKDVLVRWNVLDNEQTPWNALPLVPFFEVGQGKILYVFHEYPNPGRAEYHHVLRRLRE